MTRAPAEVGSAANSYEILAKLAMGGMAEIFLARGASSAGVERYVVLKRVLRNRASDAHFVRMFLDEARLAAQLQHPNIAQVYDIGKLGDSYFFTMEYVHGETVRTLLQRSHGLRRPIPISSVLSIIAGSAAGLHHAHERKGMDGKPLGIVHRDVSPSNLMVSYEGTVKVVDFGVAKAAHRSTETQSGTVKGKITYMSPEQCKGGDIDRRSDLFSLGIVMWEMLTTERLFRRASDFENMQAIVSEDVPPPSSLRPDVPRDLDQIVMRLLSKKAGDRYQSGDELHEAVENAAVRTGSALSAASLGRFIRELFGQRPEPWIELQSHETHPEAYTVTSEPIPAELGIAPDVDLDLRLSAIPQLSQRMSAQQTAATGPPRPPAPVLGMPTVPLRVQAEPNFAMTLQGHNPDAAVTLQQSGKNVVEMRTPRAPTNPHVAPRSNVPPVAATPGSGVVVMRPHTPSFTPGSSPNYPVVSSSSHPALVGGAYSKPPPPEARRSRALMIIVPASIIGIVIGIALGFGGGKEKAVATSETVAMTPGTPEAPIAAPPVEPTPVPVAEPVVGQLPKPEPRVVEKKPEPVVEKPEPVVEKPEPVVENPEPVVENPEPAVAKKPEPAAEKKPGPKPRDTKPKDDLASLFEADKWSAVVDLCADSTKVVALNSTMCTVAACKAREASKAKRWFGSVGAAKRASVIKDCTGVTLVDPPPTPKSTPTQKPTSAEEACKRDPMACQH